jgi:hypothetical protein
MVYYVLAGDHDKALREFTYGKFKNTCTNPPQQNANGLRRNITANPLKRYAKNTLPLTTN